MSTGLQVGGQLQWYLDDEASNSDVSEYLQHHGMNVHGRRLTSQDRAIGVPPLALMASQKHTLRCTHISLLRVFRARVWGVFALNPETGVCGHTQGKHQLRPDWPRCI